MHKNEEAHQQKEIEYPFPWLLPGIPGALRVETILILFLLTGIFQVQVPLVFDLLAPARTPQDHEYTSFVGIHLSLPADWVVQNPTEDLRLSGSSQAAFDASLPSEETAIFRTQIFVDSPVASDLDVCSPKAIVEFIVNDGLNTHTDASRRAIKKGTAHSFVTSPGGFNYAV